jgi:hypothetical protein
VKFRLWRTSGAASLVAGLVAATAFGATSILDAKSLALRQQDFPPSARRAAQNENRSALLPGGGTGQAYATTFDFREGSRTKAVGLIVITAPTVAIARRVYSTYVADARRTASPMSTLTLPALGDQQYAALVGLSVLHEASAVVTVRRKTVVWQLQVSSIRNPFGYTRAEALVELKKYATKQQRRVGVATAP